MKFRQIHLDFHTSESIEEVGNKFDKKQFQQALEEGHVNSINVFAKCHHGYSYYPSKVNEIHPGLKVDLLGNIIEAATEIGAEVPIYISSGLDEKAARKHPEWLIRNKDESTRWTSNFMQPGYHELCFNTPYLEELLKQIEEVLHMYKPKGLWLDIVGVRPCYCRTCVQEANAKGIDIENEKEMETIWEKTYKNYQRQVAKLVAEINPSTHIFHNSGHFARGREDLWEANTHYELESLPTGGWSYDHFPMSARYIQGFGVDFLGMTGKFHTSWGEFGGFKHPNALRYEMALDLMNGAKCCVGDQLHPNGEMDLATYRLIGQAYEEVERKEAWCDHVVSIADIGVFSAEVIEGTKMMSEFNNLSDSGVARMLFEGHYLFDLIDHNSLFDKYKLIILPDKIRLDEQLKEKLEAFISKGGKVLATGESGLSTNHDQFVLDMGVEYMKKNPYQPSYLKPEFSIKSVDNSSYVFYEDSFLVKATRGEVIGNIEKPYHNRTYKAFCSHKHFPTSHEVVSPGIVLNEDTCYISWNVFKDYAMIGSIVYKEMVYHIIDQLLGINKTIKTSLSSQGSISLMHQEDKKRLILHTVYAIPVMRGRNINVIEDIQPIYNIKMQLTLNNKIKKVSMAPSLEELTYEIKEDQLSFVIPKVDCHQMVVIDYE